MERLEDWLKFKSGSDIRGVAYEGGERPVDLTDGVVEAMAAAFYVWLSNRLGKRALRIALGHDSRLSAPRMRAAVARSLVSCGAEVIDCGLSSTPAMFMITVDKSVAADGSVQLTASHHPFDKNGLKFFTAQGGLEGADIEDILRLACEKRRILGSGSLQSLDYMSVYADGLVRMVQERTGEKRPLAGMKIVVDAGNGAGGFYVDKVLSPLGADTSGSQFLEPDGRFPNHIPNPENADAMASVCGAVKRADANFGIIFDTDVDRAGAVDGSGEEINRNRLIALISAILLEEHPGATIVTDSVTSDGLAEFIAARGGVHRRFKRGYKNVINECIRLNEAGVDSPLAIETSGHAALRENYFLDDGAYLMTRLLVSLARARAEGKDLMELVSGLRMPAEELEVRLGFSVRDFKACGQAVIEGLKRAAEIDPELRLAPDNCEGVRVNCDDGWFLVRMSVHDPILPINIESDRPGGARRIAARLNRLLAGCDGLIRDNLEKIISEDR